MRHVKAINNNENISGRGLKNISTISKKLVKVFNILNKKVYTKQKTAEMKLNKSEEILFFWQETHTYSFVGQEQDHKKL